MLDLIKALNVKVTDLLSRTLLTLTNQGSVPANPSANQFKVYYRNSILYTLDSSGIEREIGGSGEFIPIGAIMPFYGAAVPSGWLLANGSTFSQPSYPGLYTFLGNSNVLPDLRGAFLRGKNNGRVDGNQDPDGERAIGHFQLDDFKSHNHTSQISLTTSGSTTTPGLGSGTPRTSDPSNSSGGLETRPKNIAVNWIIKAKNTPATQYQINASAGLSLTLDDINKVANLSLDTSTIGIPKGYLSGLTLSNNTITPLTKIDVSTGVSADSTGSVSLNLYSPITKRLNASWLLGNDQGGLASALSLTNATWYHTFIISNGISTDIYFDNNLNAINKPSGYAYFRYIGSIYYIDGINGIKPFFQIGNRFYWITPTLDLNIVNVGTTRNLYTLTVPKNINALASLNLYRLSETDYYIAFPGTSDQAPMLVQVLH